MIFLKIITIIDEIDEIMCFAFTADKVKTPWCEWLLHPMKTDSRRWILIF